MSDILYSGCMVQARLPFVESAFRFIAEKIEKKIKNMENATCCMEPVGLRSMNEDTRLAVNARLHSISNGKRIITLCEGCNLSLSEAGMKLKDGNGKKAIEVVSSMGYESSISEVSGSLQFIYDNIDLIKEKIVSPVDRKLAIFPGCHGELICSKEGRSAILMMENILKAIGATPLRPTEDLCCGGGAIDPAVDSEILNETVGSFKDMNAEAVVTSCPFCFMRFDMVAKYPTYHLAEIIAMAMGYDDTMKYHLSKHSQ